MPYETYQPLFRPKTDPVIRPGKTLTLPLTGDHLHQATRLFFTGETATFYHWKNEPDEPQFYRRIDDALDSAEADRAAYALHLHGQNDAFPIRACTKIMWKPVLSYLSLSGYTDEWTCGVRAKARGIKVQEGGYLRMRFEVRYKIAHADGDAASADYRLSDHRTIGRPDAVQEFVLTEGSYDWKELTASLTIPTEETANVFVVLEGLHFTGDIWFESPHLTSSNGYNIVPDFQIFTEDRPQFNWLGQNLSQKEWPSFDVQVNGQLVWSGPVFERCHRYSEWQIDLPQGVLVNGGNTLSLTLTTHCREPLPYRLHEVGAIFETGADRPVQLIAVPENVTAGEIFGILIRTKDPSAKFSFASDKVMLVKGPNLDSPGLHVLSCRVNAPGTHLALTVNGQSAEIRRAVLRQKDGVITGTGDMIYVDQNASAVSEFLSWYLAGGFGNLLTIRPTYRWCGCRAIDPSVWETVVRVLNGMRVKYAHMIDGREIPGANTNPAFSLLEGPGFLGRQLHERDGAHVYWGYKPFTGRKNEELYYDLMLRMLEEYPEETNPFICPENMIEAGGEQALYRNIHLPADMKVMADHFVQQLERTRYGATRHTGPSTLFKYFYQAGYRWTGAETMYGPMELVCSALRGAASVYGQSSIGAHHAVQWSTTPHDILPRYRRYRIALYVSYMQGVHEINTEEGLWHMEEYYHAHDRFSEAARNHQKQQQDFYRYVSSHSRSGFFYTPIAFLQGRYDGWRVFGRNGVWGRPDWKASAPEESWDLINYYYPLSLQDAIYRHPCISGPVGFHTGTPHGNIDILPVEAPTYEPYRLVAMLGYNCCSADDLDKLRASAQAGATVLIGWPQLSITTKREDVIHYNHQYINHPFVHEIAGAPAFTEQHKDGASVWVGPSVFGAEVFEETDEGLPLIYRVPIGKGSVVFVNAGCYVADPAVKGAYLRVLDRLTEEVLAEETSYVTTDENVQFTAFAQDDGSRHYYLLAVDWWNPTDTLHTACLRLQDATFPISVPWGVLLKVVTNGHTAAWCESEEGEVLSISDAGMTVQGVDTCTFHVIRHGVDSIHTVSFAEQAVQTIEI